MPNVEVINNKLGEMYEQIIHDEFVFPEFVTSDKVEAKTLSLKAHSILSRMLKVWLTDDGTNEE